MLVETYEVEETNSEAATMAADSEAAELIQSLGLKGQERLFNPETVTRFPYRKMTEAEGRIYGVLCPVRCKIENYSDGIIPLRVLQVASHAIGFVDLLQVWYPRNADIKDPILVGIKGNEYNGEIFLLARWGTELLPLEQLHDIAVKLYRTKIKAKLEDIAAKVRAKLETIDTATLNLGEEPYYAD